MFSAGSMATRFAAWQYLSGCMTKRICKKKKWNNFCIILKLFSQHYSEKTFTIYIFNPGLSWRM
jgi:hypothetical protein